MPTTTYSLNADAGIRDIAELWDELRTALSVADSVLELDAEAVARPDTALVQFITVVVVRARALGKTVKVVRPSARLRELLSLLGLNVVLGD